MCLTEYRNRTIIAVCCRRFDPVYRLRTRLPVAIIAVKSDIAGTVTDDWRRIIYHSYTKRTGILIPFAVFKNIRNRGGPFFKNITGRMGTTQINHSPITIIFRSRFCPGHDFRARLRITLITVNGDIGRTTADFRSCIINNRYLK